MLPFQAAFLYLKPRFFISPHFHVSTFLHIAAALRPGEISFLDPSGGASASVYADDDSVEVAPQPTVNAVACAAACSPGSVLRVLACLRTACAQVYILEKRAITQNLRDDARLAASLYQSEDLPLALSLFSSSPVWHRAQWFCKRASWCRALIGPSALARSAHRAAFERPAEEAAARTLAHSTQEGRLVQRPLSSMQCPEIQHFAAACPVVLGLLRPASALAS
jgi:hypothetical protein